MINCVVFGNNYYISSISSISTITSTSCRRRSRFKSRAFLNKPPLPLFPNQDTDTSSVVLDNSLRLLEWDKLCDSVSSFASTSFGKQATKAQLWYLNQTYEESMRLLGETNAAVEMHKHGGCVMDFNGIDVVLVKSAIQHAQRGLPVNGSEAMAIVALLQFAENLQLNLKAAMKEDTEWYQRFMPLAEMIMELVVSRSLVKFVQQLIDEDGSVKDSASSALKRLRDQVRMLENKLYQLMDSLIRNKMKETSTVEVSNVDGRMCLRLGADSPTSFEGLLLSSGSGGGSIVEPLSAVPLNDELQQANASVAKAEADVLLKITEKMQGDLGDIENLFNSMIQLDVINARATYSLSFGGTCPDLFLPGAKDGGLALDALLGNTNLTPSYLTERKWTLYLPRAYHPLLLQQHRQNLRKAVKDVSNATAEIRRRKLQGENMTQREETDINLSSLEMQVTKLKQAHPIPVDIFVAQKTKVLVITGPNTGGKTIYLKTVGLAAVMAKSGLHVLASEPVKIPWFDSVFADIGDEQSLSQSLSTFSGHLKQISEILKHSTSRSLVLLDEVGAGTNPLEGAALGMSLLESFAESGPLLTIATTHHGELKTLKYSNEAFENACMEFDEVKLKPTYRILWGVPGRSNAINIAERLGLPNVILDIARELYGAASAEINEVILEMERLKKNIHDHVSEAQNYLKLTRELHENLLTTRRKVMDHGTDQRYMKMREISEMAAMARSILQKKVRQIRSATQPFQLTVANNNQLKSTINSQHAAADNSDSSEPSIASANAHKHTETLSLSLSLSLSSKMGSSSAGVITLFFSLLLLISSAHSFYLPGVAPRDFQRGDPLQVKVNKLSSTKTQLPYDYYFLKYCKPTKIMNSAENLGEVLRGDRIENSMYTFNMREEQPCKVACRVTLDAESAKNFKEKIDDEYRVNMILDNLPVAVLRQRRDGSPSTTYEHGFRVGFKGNYAGSKEEKYFINNHLSFRVMYHKDLETDSARIVSFEITPNSINHEYKDWDEKNPQLTTCNQNTKNIIQGSTVPQEVDTDKVVVFTYDVSFKESDVKWASRWDTYLLMNDDQIHWFSIINSLMIVLFLSGMVAMIMMRTLYRDIANYNQLETQDEAQEETGWKLLHGDVFRVPINSGLLCVYVGTGVQLFAMALVTMIFAVLGFLSPSNRGGLMTAMVLLWVFMGLFGGYSSARLYKMFKGAEWKRNTLKTAFMFPGILFSIFFVLNALIWGEKSSGAVPFGTMFALVCLWFGISVPLVFVGSYLGFKKPAIEDPVKTNKIPRQIPEQAWYMKPVFSILIGGILPFGAVFIELFFILTSIWLNQFYYIFGFLFIVFVILIITCAEIAIVLCYFQLCSEDYYWWWRAYLTAGSSALYLFLYSIFYFFTKLEITKLVSGILYFGYMLIVSYAFFVLTGTIGFYACFWFVRKIYSSVKID